MSGLLIFGVYVAVGAWAALTVGVTLARRDVEYRMDHDFDLLGAVLAGAFWPLGVPVFFLWTVMRAEAKAARRERITDKSRVDR